MSHIFKASLVITLFTGWLSFEVSAQEINHATKIESCLTDTTIGFARVRLDRLDFTSLEQLAKKSFGDQPGMNQQVAALLGPVKQLRQQFIEVGVTEFHVVLDLEFIRFGPYLLIEHRDDANTEQIGNLIKGITGPLKIFTGQTIEPFRGFLFAGDPLILNHLKEGHTAPRPHLADALKTVDSAAIQIMYCPTDDQLRAIRETVPTLPPPGDQIDGVKLADGIQFATIGLRLEPEPVVSLRIHSRTEEAAELLKQVQHDSLNVVAEMAQKMMPVPGFEDVVKTLKLNRNGVKLLMDYHASESQSVEPLMRLFNTMLQRQLVNSRYQELNNTMKRLGIAMHNWHDVHKVLPAHANYSQDETPLLSWRVHILPYLDNQALYEQFHLDEPWDSPHNKSLIPLMPGYYKVPGSKVAKEGKTGIVFPILPDGSAITTGTKNGIQMREIEDGTVNTAMITVVDDEHSVIWTKPDDLTINPDQSLKGLLRWKRANGESVIPATFADGSMHSLPADMDATLWLKLLTRAGGEVVEIP